MGTDNSMNDVIDKMVSRYPSLFMLPSHQKIIVLLLAFCLINGVLTASALEPVVNFGIFALGLVLGVAFFVLTMIVDFAVHLISFRRDPIFNLRRCSALSLYSIIFLLVFIILGIIANVFFRVSWFKLFFLGFSAVSALRLLVLFSVSFASISKVFSYAVLLPALYTVPVVSVALLMGENVLNTSTMLFLFTSLTIIMMAVLFFARAINRVGVGILGVNSISVLRAFLASWTEDLNEPFEQVFERFGVERDIKVSALAFKTKERLKAMIVVPAFHPGPFKNVGSSSLPYTIQIMLENKYPMCVVSVPHGLSGHDLDIASQTQNHLVLEKVQKLTELSNFSSVATPFVRVKKDGASVGCQRFNDCSFVTLTLAPETMEDLPPELDSFIDSKAKKLGLSTVISVDAHNSIQGSFDIEKAIDPLKETAKACLKKASQQKLNVLEVGAARVTPKEFSLSEGMGPGGIVVTLVKVVGQLTAYVTIDGNNMVSGLRERILRSLSEAGIDDGEILTTDTHAVNAVDLTARGYHPVGEAIDQEKLITYIKKATMDALANLEQVEVAWQTETVPHVKVIGEKQIEALSLLVEKASKKAKRLAVSLFPIIGAFLVALLVLL